MRRHVKGCKATIFSSVQLEVIVYHEIYIFLHLANTLQNKYSWSERGHDDMTITNSEHFIDLIHTNLLHVLLFIYNK